MTNSQFADIAQAADHTVLEGETVLTKLISALTPFLQEGKHISFIGHSSGGAMAIVAAAKLNHQFGDAIKRNRYLWPTGSGDVRYVLNAYIHFQRAPTVSVVMSIW